MIDPQKARKALANDFANLTPELFRERLEAAIPAWAGSGCEEEQEDEDDGGPFLLVLNAEEWDRFMEEINDPSPPNEKLVEAMKRRRKFRGGP